MHGGALWGPHCMYNCPPPPLPPHNVEWHQCVLTLARGVQHWLMGKGEVYNMWMSSLITSSSISFDTLYTDNLQKKLQIIFKAKWLKCSNDLFFKIVADHFVWRCEINHLNIRVYPYATCQITLPCKTLLAIFTLIWFLFGLIPLVFCQVTILCKTFLPIFTLSDTVSL